MGKAREERTHLRGGEKKSGGGGQPHGPLRREMCSDKFPEAQGGWLL